MQISLDYYRILGVPVQAESHLIDQAYEDRIQQLPHHSYTEYAIASRKKLVTKAYGILSDERSRRDYDSSFFQNQEETPTGEVFREVSITISDDLFVGALIILLNLGEYELVLKLAKPYLKDKNLARSLIEDSSKTDEDSEEFSRLWQDLILSVILAHLELAREKWHDHEYDSAANSLQESYQLLTEEQIFTKIRKEIRQDLGKLRPYQILELFTQHADEPLVRKKGINLLQEMFDNRGGIENQEVDESGLNVDGFLRFIQQIRSYLTVAEQQELFEQEAKRPSPAAAYLAASAGIARGITEKRPELIVEAKNNLLTLTLQQDVYLEQSICALLLGQTAEAEFSLTQSKEKDVIDYIQQISQDSPDLLPGLCLYAEKWLQTEILPQFEDLKHQTASLQEYFGDDFVQTYLESLSPSLDTEHKNYSADLQLSNFEMDSSASLLSDDVEAELSELMSPETSIHNLEEENITPPSLIVDETAPEENVQGAEDFFATENIPKTSTSYSYDDSIYTNATSSSTTQVNETASSNIPLTSSVKSNQVKPTPRVKESKWKIADKLIVYMFIALLSVLGIGFITWQFLFKPRGQVEQLEISLSEPLIELPAPIPPIPESPINQNLGSNLDQTKALSLINQWLEAKKEATGPNYNLAKLNQILTEPQLSLWVGNAKTLRANNAYRRYEHEVEILSAEINPENVSQAIITAIVKEQSQHYVNGALLSNLSYNEELVVDYLLVKEGDQWFIQGIEIVKTN